MSTPMLTPRERDVLDLTAAGLDQGEIARELSLTVGTVNAHASHLRCKLDADTMAHAVAIAYQRGLLGGLS
jgi:DNA-binding CsgD family transcriptional regulator